jgi:SlyX protein
VASSHLSGDRVSDGDRGDKRWNSRDTDLPARPDRRKGQEQAAMDRTEAMEERIAHLMRAVDDLSDVVAAQAAEIARLTRLVQLLMEREADREAAGGGTIPLADERPPHW